MDGDAREELDVYDSFAAPTPLTGPHPLSRLGAMLHSLGRGADRSRVFVQPDGACRVVRRGERLRLRDAVGGAYRGVYYVDEDGHTVDVSCELPSRDGGLRFDGRVRLLWWVHDVERAVQSRVGEVRNALQPFLEAYLGRITREHPVSDLGAAEERVRRELTGDLPLEIGLTIRPLTVTLRMDDTSPSYDDQVTEVQREILLEEARGRLAVLRAQNEVAAWRVRLEFYRQVVEAGLPSLLALRLMVDPGAAGEVAGLAQALPPDGPGPWQDWPRPDAVEGGRSADEPGPGHGHQPGQGGGGVIYLPGDPGRQT